MKKMLLKVLIPLIVLFVLTLTLLSGCDQAQQAVESAVESAVEEVSEAVETTAETTAAEETAAATEAEVITLDIGYYADAADSYYQVEVDTFIACAELDPECDWNVNFKVGQSTAAEQLQAVEDFIMAGYDAIVVIQNNPDTTSECIAKCVDAGIPYFGASHSFAGIENRADAAGSCCFNFIQAGLYGGEDAVKRDVKKIVMIEGVLGQGSASAQTLGYLQAFEEAGISLGNTAKEVAEQKMEVKLDGTQEVEVVAWASGGWFSDPAQKAMTDFITSLGPDGFDAVYAQNNPMMEGVLMAMEDAGLNPSDYNLYSCNGREISWQWVKDGIIKQDVNQPASLEGETIYQQVKAFFKGEEYRKYVHPYLTPYSVDDIDEIYDSLVPFSDVDAYMEKRAAGAFVTDINDPKWTDQEGY